MCCFRVDLLPYDLTTQLFKILTIETKQEKGLHSTHTLNHTVCGQFVLLLTVVCK